MSRGPGKIERAVVEHLTELARESGTGCRADTLAFYIFDTSKVTEAQERSVRRALRHLKAQGIVFDVPVSRINARYWQLTNPPKRRRQRKKPRPTLADILGLHGKLAPDVREQLVRVLGMLGSDYPGERESAARIAERIRSEHGLLWNELLR